jgi:C-terminal processing protease CtpA/Prc
MKTRKISCLVAVLAGLAACSGRPVYAEEPVRSEVLVQAPNQTRSSAAEFLLSQIADAKNEHELKFAAETYGNLLGIEVAESDPAIRAQLGPEEGGGVVVTKISKDAEAANTGLRQYDLVLKVDDQAIGTPGQFDELIGQKQGKAISLQMIRKGKPQMLAIQVPEKAVYRLAVPLKVRAAFEPKLREHVVVRLWNPADGAQGEQRYRIGVNLSEADDTLRSQLRLASGEGLVVNEVVTDSPADKAGIQKNDVLIKLDEKRLTTAAAVNAQIQEVRDRKVPMALYRGGREIVVEVAPRLVSDPNVMQELTARVEEVIQLHEAELKAAKVSDRVRAAAIAALQPTIGEQLAAIKRQLAELQKTVDALEAALPTVPAEQPTTPEEKK